MNSRALYWLTAVCLPVTALLMVLLAPSVSHPADTPARAASDFSPYVSKKGSISLPGDYREKFLHLGTWAVARKPDKPVVEMHNVYARLKDIQAYQRGRKFPDGAVLVKEITKVRSDKLTTGQASWSTDIKSWFVMVKDSKARFPGNDLWGNGRGLGAVRGEGPEAERGDRLQNRLPPMPRSGEEGRLGVHPRIPDPREARPRQVKRLAWKRMHPP